MSSAAPVSTGGVTKSRAAAVSIFSNSALIALKLAAAAVTGSVAILSEALHSMIDLIASVVAFVSVRKADEPADVDHPYGHEKVENVGAAIEAMLILVGAGVIVYEAVNRLSTGATVDQLGLGIAVIAFSGLANVGVSRFLSRQATRQNSAALAGDAAHLGTDAFTSAGVLVGLLLVQITGANAIDSVVAIIVAGVIVVTGVRLLRRSTGALVDEAPPPEEMDRVEAAIARARADAPEVVGYHKLRARTTGRRTYVDMHVQFADGTTLEHAHEVAHRLRDAVEADLGDAEVLIHVEPESSKVDPAESPSAFRAG
jgi:cation diffusion facilitator family transporter